MSPSRTAACLRRLTCSKEDWASDKGLRVLKPFSCGIEKGKRRIRHGTQNCRTSNDRTARTMGVDHVYGIPGDSINEFIEELRHERNQLKFIQTRHEEVAALATAAEAKLTGKIGVCLSIAGPGRFTY